MHTDHSHPARGVRIRRRTLVVGAVATAVLLVGCGSDSEGSSTSTTEKPTTTAKPTTAPASSTTAVPKGTKVETTFAATASAAEADQAAEVMTERLEAVGYEGSVATVNVAGNGLTVRVVGVTSPEEATSIVTQLSVNGKLYFRPVLQGPIAPGYGETHSQQTTDILNTLSPGSTVPGATIATTSPDQDQPDGTSVLQQLDLEGAVVARWQVGPEEVDATAIAGAKLTTYQDSNAVQVVMKGGDPGIDQFNAMAQACFEKAATCPTGVYGVVFDSVVITVSSVRPDDSSFEPFSTTGVILWSPDWTPEKAKVITAIIKVGEMPVGLTVS